MLLKIAILVFAAVACGTMAVYFMLKARLDWQAKATKQRLDELGRAHESTVEQVSILRSEEKLSTIPAMDRMLRRFAIGDHLKKLIVQSGSNTNVGVIVLATFSLGLLTLLVVQTLMHNLFLAVLLAPVPAALPYMFLRRKRTKRLREFEEQLPEALDMIVNALRSGFTFELALKMVAQEAMDPLAYEFAVVFEQQNLGVSLEDALAGLRYRVPSEDLDILIIALVLNRRTGGNLAEVLEKASSTIRDRFRLKREVRTKTAHGRFSGFVLITLPIFMAGILTVLAPDYLLSMVKEPAGQWLLGTAIVMQLLGIFVIRKIIDIKI